VKIELRKVCYSKALSQETSAFTAEVWVDGKKRGDARNDGHGGTTLVNPFSLRQEIEEHAKTLPPLPPSKYFPKESPMDADLLLGTLLEEHLLAKDLRSALKKKVLFTRADGKLYQLRGTTRPANLGAGKILNDMPFEEALKVYKTAGA
jgi:hypothetical protein